MKLIYGDTRECTWLKAIKHLIRDDNEKMEEYNLILEITNPSKGSPRSKKIREDYDRLLGGSKLPSVHTVAETIFPMVEYKQSGLKGVTEVYPKEIYPLICKSPGNSKGTYALRIVRSIDAKGKECNPLQNVIDRLKKQLENSNGNRLAYEVSFNENAEAISVNRNDTSLRGFPCLSHLSFKLSSDKKSLYLTAIYRSQHFVLKALGNLLGLARLQKCVAKEIGLEVGPLVCHATFATFDRQNGIGKGRMKKFIKTIEDEHGEC